MRRIITIIVLVSVTALAGCGGDDAPVATDASTTSTTSTSTSSTAISPSSTTTAPDPGSSTTVPPTTTTTLPDSASDQDRLDAARARWAAAGVDDYEIRWTQMCFCPRISFVDRVEDGVAVDHRPAEDHEGFEDPGPKTMDTIFDEIQAAIDSDPHSLDADYDPVNGAVVSYFVDVEEMMVDEERGLSVELTVV